MLNPILKITNVITAATIVASSLLANVALAQEASPPPPRALPDPRPRAEVQAERQIWRESGLAALEHSPEHIDYFSPKYLRAKDRYAQLRDSPYFDSLVHRYAEGRGGHDKVAKR
jgi:hypothetical protein